MLKDKYLEWKVDQLRKPFSDDQEFFRENYGCTLTPFCKELFAELLDIDRRLMQLEGRAARQDLDNE